MRVLYFSTGYSSHDHRFLAALARTEHQTFYVRLEPDRRATEDRPVPPEIRQIQWTAGRVPFRWARVPALAANLRRLLANLKPDLVHAGPIQTCAFLTALAGFRPLLTMSWGFDLMQDAERNAWWRWVTRYTLRRSAFFVSDAEVTRDRAIAFGMHPDRTAVFPWGVDLSHFAPGKTGIGKSAGGKAPAVQNAPFVVFCNRSWEPRHGVDVLARAFVRVAEERDNVSLLLVSGGSQAQAIRQILMTAHLLERVQFGGQVSQADLPRWYRMADLFVSPSHVDGSSVSLMEAMACGLPVVVSNIPANREWVNDGENGWLFQDGDAEALAQKILAVMERRDALARAGLLARKTAEARADWSKNFAVLLGAYQQAMQAAS